jgi:hypothetical protein
MYFEYLGLLACQSRRMRLYRPMIAYSSANIFPAQLRFGTSVRLVVRVIGNVSGLLDQLRYLKIISSHSVGEDD